MSSISINTSATNIPTKTTGVNDGRKIPEDKKKELEKLKAACSDFESIFMNQMLKEMRKTVNKSKFIHGGQAEEIFSDMLDQEKSKEMSVGIGDVLYKQLERSILPPKRPR